MPDGKILPFVEYVTVSKLSPIFIILEYSLELVPVALSQIMCCGNGT